MLFTQAAQAMGDAAPTPAPEPSEPVGDEDFNGLLEKQKALANKLQGLRKQETELLARLQSVRDEAVALENQSRVIKEKAQVLFVTFLD